MDFLWKILLYSSHHTAVLVRRSACKLLATLPSLNHCHFYTFFVNANSQLCLGRDVSG